MAIAQAGLTARVWWGDRLLDQRFVSVTPAVEEGLRCELVRALRPEPVKIGLLSQLREFAVPVALIGCLVAALVVAVVPARRGPIDAGDLGVGDRLGARGGASRPVQLANTSKPLAARPRDAIVMTTFELDRPLAISRRTKAPRDVAKQLVDELFAGVGPLVSEPGQLEASLQGLRSAASTESERGLGGGRELSLSSRGADGADLGIGALRTVGRSAWGSGVGLMGSRKSVVIVDPIDAPILIGTLSPEVIRRVMHAHRAEIRFCYESALQAEPSLSGRLGMRFVIAPSGSVASVEVTSSLGNQALEDCLRRRVRAIQFPPVGGGGEVIVNWPWTFASAGH